MEYSYFTVAKSRWGGPVHYIHQADRTVRVV